jgi:hypothetical protein
MNMEHRKDYVLYGSQNKRHLEFELPIYRQRVGSTGAGQSIMPLIQLVANLSP